MTVTIRDLVSGKRWLHLLWLGPFVVVILAAVVLLANAMRNTPVGEDFIAQFPGYSELPDGAPVGFPAWLSWQHFLNSLFILLIIRTGWQVRTMTRVPAYWTRHNKGLFRTKNPPIKISLTLWLHLCLDALWVLNGVVFYVLIAVTGQWMRLVPVSWDVIPNAISAGLQYLSLDWPKDNGWANYNSLQLLAYFVTVFIAAPLAIITGVRMSGAWPLNATRLNRLYPIGLARKIHFPVMLYFVLFVIAHVALVFATDAPRNLNHMYGGADEKNWTGFLIFAGSVLVMVVAWFVMRPLFLRPIASVGGSVSR